MIEPASQPIPAKPALALALVTRSRLLLAAIPSTLLLLLCFTLAAELSALEMSPVNDVTRSRWPSSMVCSTHPALAYEA